MTPQAWKEPYASNQLKKAWNNWEDVCVCPCGMHVLSMCDCVCFCISTYIRTYILNAMHAYMHVHAFMHMIIQNVLYPCTGEVCHTGSAPNTNTWPYMDRAHHVPLQIPHGWSLNNAITHQGTVVLPFHSLPS